MKNIIKIVGASNYRPTTFCTTNISTTFQKELIPETCLEIKQG